VNLLLEAMCKAFKFSLRFGFLADLAQLALAQFLDFMFGLLEDMYNANC
jgi:hypothetical protein